MKKLKDWFCEIATKAAKGLTSERMDMFLYLFGLIFACLVMFMIIFTLSTLQNMNSVIKEIPGVIVVEMEKINKTYQKESNTNRELVKDQHTETKEEVINKLDQNNVEVISKLNDLKKSADKKKVDVIVTPEPVIPEVTEEKKKSFFKRIFQ